LRLRHLLELATAILVIWYVYDVTGDTAQVVWVACFVLIISLGGDTYSFVRRLREKEARLRLDKFEMLSEYQDEAKDLRNMLGVMTALVVSFTYFNYTTKLSDSVIWGPLSVFLFASLWAIIEWGWFLGLLSNLRRSVRRSFSMAPFVLAVSFLVTVLVSAEIVKVMHVPFLFDTIAVFSPFIVLSILERQLAQQLGAFRKIETPTEALKELGKSVCDQVRKTEQPSPELDPMRQMLGKLGTAIPMIEQIRTLVREALENRKKTETAIREQAILYRSLAKRLKDKPPVTVLCTGRLMGYDQRSDGNGQVHRVYDPDTGLDVKDETLRQTVIRTAILFGALSSHVTVARMRLTLKRSLYLARSIAEDLLMRSFDQLFADDFSIWMSTEDLEVKARKASSIDLHITGWETIYTSRRRALLEETRARLEVFVRQYPTCELVAAYFDQLRVLLDCRREEERIWLERLEASWAFERVNPGSTRILSRTSERALNLIRRDLKKVEARLEELTRIQ